MKPTKSRNSSRAASIGRPQPSAPLMELPITEIHERLWRSLPSIQALLNDEETGAAAKVIEEQKEFQPFGEEVELNGEEMSELMHCLYMATHSNATPDDALSFLSKTVGTSENPSQPSYSKKTCFELVDQFVENHLLETANSEDVVDELARKSTLTELIDNITNDEAPFQLLSPSSVIQIKGAKKLTTFLTNFVEYKEHHKYPAVFDTLWDALQDGKVSEALSQDQFQLFFSWFYRLHVSNSTSTRSQAASLPLWYSFVDEKGHMTMSSFMEVCVHLGRVYGKRDDTATYLTELVEATKSGLQSHNLETKGAALFSASPEVVESTTPFHLSDPKQLYLPEKLYPWDRVPYSYVQPFSKTRVVVYGRRGVGKTTLGSALANALNAVHLDVFSIVLDLLQNSPKDGNVYENELAQHVSLLLQKESPIPLELQAQLVQSALEAKGTHHHGYVFSDCVAFSEENKSLCTEFYTKCGLLEEARPNAFVELLCDDDVYQGHINSLLKKRESSSREAFNKSEEHDKEEKKRMMEECNAIIQRYEDLKAAGEEAKVTPEELETAELQANESREILEALQTEGDIVEDENEDDEETRQEKLETKKNHEEKLFKAKVAALLRLGRNALMGSEEAPLSAVPEFKNLIDEAAVQRRSLNVNCFSPVEDTVAYVTKAMGILPASVATDVPLPDSETRTTATANTTEEEEALNGLIEEAATAASISPSYLWKRFCPVTFYNESLLVEGALCYSCVYEGNLYSMASEEKKKEFQKDPYRFVSQRPVGGTPILLLAEDTVLETLNKQQLLDEVSDRMRLTPLNLVDFHHAVEEWANLRDSRAAVHRSREEFELVERKARQERSEKRRKQEGKKRNKEKQPAVTFGEEPTKPTREEVKKPDPRKKGRVQDDIKEKIAGLLDERKTILPILVSGLDGVDVSLLDLLVAEDFIPRQVVVLEHEEISFAQQGDDEAEEEPPKKVSSLVEVLKVLTKFSNASKESFTIHHLNTFEKDMVDIVNEIDTTFNPAAPTAEEGTVDEELGQEEEDEEEEDLGEEEEDEVRRPAKPQNPLLKPKKKFEHQFGALLQYCPVTYKHRGILVKGQNEFSLSYLGKLYLFTTEANKELFRTNPLAYLRDINIRRTPPRIWMVGPTYSGKKTLGHSLEELYDVSVFTYDRAFFENCIETARSEDGRYVNGIFIPPQNHSHPFLKRAYDILSEVRRIEAQEKERLKLRDEAIKALEELEQKREEEDYEEEIGEEEEERLREQSEYEPEDEEEKQIRLSESYLRIASCVVRIEPFEKKGYIMICPPFSEGDLDILFSEGGIPEVVVRMDLTKDEFCRRGKLLFEKQKKSRFSLHDAIERERKKELTKEKRKQAKRELKLKKWRRRNLGKDDPEEEEEPQEEGGAVEDTADPQEEPLHQPDFEGSAALQLEAVEGFIGGLEERLVKVVTINADLAPGAVSHYAVLALDRHLASRISLLFLPEVIPFDAAQTLLNSGNGHFSYFLETDPVTLYQTRNGKKRVCKWKPDGFSITPEPVEENNDTGAEGKEDVPPDEEVSEYGSEDLEEMRQRYKRRQLKKLNETARRTATLGPFVFFFDTDETLLEFLKNPVLYLEQAPPSPALSLSPVCSVFEGGVFPSVDEDGVKRRGLAESIAYNLGAVFISAGKLLSWAVRQPVYAAVHRRALSCCLQGEASDEDLAKLLELRLSAADVKRKGAVLLNLPRSVGQVKAMRTPHCAPLCKFAVAVQEKETFPLLESICAEAEGYANVEWRVPYPEHPFHPANLSEMVDQVDQFTEKGREAQERLPSGYAVSLNDTYYTKAQLLSEMSEYKDFCPYRWVEDGDIIKVNIDPPANAAQYLGKIYFFSTSEYLERFLDDPTEIADPQNVRPLPSLLPEIVKEKVPLSELEHQGCCPVLLYDTRDRRGLRGVIEPIAQKGSMDCLVRYDGKTYALLNETNMNRFIMCPWQFVEGAAMPEYRKRPLDEGRTVADVKDNEYIRRYLYDALAQAMKDVGTLRPIYPELSPEESALKYIALHMKAHNTAENNDIQSAQYTENFKVFQNRSQLYHNARRKSIEQTEEEKKMFDQLCEEYERLQYGEKSLHTLSQLKSNGCNSV